MTEAEKGVILREIRPQWKTRRRMSARRLPDPFPDVGVDSAGQRRRIDVSMAPPYRDHTLYPLPRPRHEPLHSPHHAREVAAFHHLHHFLHLFELVQQAIDLLHGNPRTGRSEEHTSELQSPCNLVCRLLLEKKNINTSIALPTRFSTFTCMREPSTLA